MKPYYSANGVTIYQGDSRELLRGLPDESVHCVVTSPPYWGLRDYGVQGQMGLESTPYEYISTMRMLFAEVRRVLRADGTLWLNMGDSYAASDRGGGGGSFQDGDVGTKVSASNNRRQGCPGFKPKDLVGIPWALATALRDPYYTGQIKAERDRVWLAAIIDGEGTICGYEHERSDDGRVRTGVNISITNSCELMLNEAQRIWPGSRHRHMAVEHLGQREVYRWIPFRCDANSELLRELLPYLVSKKVQALVAWNLLEFVKDGRKLGKSAMAADIRDKRSRLVQILRKLNHSEHPDLPTWLKEPPSLWEPGWYLRQDLIWAKPNPMPESVTDRCTKAHEYIFLLSKSERYYYNQEATKEPTSAPTGGRARAALRGDDRYVGHVGNEFHKGRPGRFSQYQPDERNKRSVWTVNPQPFPEAHFATFPEDLIKPCILAGCPEGGTVLDPFGGAGTTALVARKLHSKAILLELNAEYCEIAAKRLSQEVLQFADQDSSPSAAEIRVHKEVAENRQSHCPVAPMSRSLIERFRGRTSVRPGQ